MRMLDRYRELRKAGMSFSRAVDKIAVRRVISFQMAARILQLQEEQEETRIVKLKGRQHRWDNSGCLQLVCNDCHTWKKATDFHKNRQAKFGRQNKCKICSGKSVGRYRRRKANKLNEGGLRGEGGVIGIIQHGGGVYGEGGVTGIIEQMKHQV